MLLPVPVLDGQREVDRGFILCGVETVLKMLKSRSLDQIFTNEMIFSLLQRV